MVTNIKPEKPAGFPLFAHNNGQWAKKIDGKMYYFGPWNSPEAALAKYQEQVSQTKKRRAKKAERQANKPPQPYADYPLTAHPSGQWCKKINGKLYYFGIWSEPEAALERYLNTKDDLMAGREPACYSNSMTIRELADRFLTTKRSDRDRGAITKSHYRQLDENVEFVVRTFGPGRRLDTLRASDFEDLGNKLPKTWKPKTRVGVIGRMRSFFLYGNKFVEKPFDLELFRQPSPKELRIYKSTKPKKKFEAVEIRRMLKSASVTLRAMILLGINCGFSNRDCGALPREDALDLKRGWFDFSRPKTGILRWGPLWPETVAVLNAYVRPSSKNPESDKYFFVTEYGNPYFSAEANVYDPISKQFSKLCKGLGIHRDGIGFQALRSTFRTLAGEARDKAGADWIMGHCPPQRDMGEGVYTAEYSDERLRRITDHVRSWLFSESEFQMIDNHAA